MQALEWPGWWAEKQLPLYWGTLSHLQAADELPFVLREMVTSESGLFLYKQSTVDSPDQS